MKDPRLNASTSSNQDYLQKLMANSRHEPLTAIHKFGELPNDRARAKRLGSTDQAANARQLAASSNSPSVQSHSQHTKAMRILSISESAATAPVKPGSHLAGLSKSSLKQATRVKSETDSADTDNLFVEDSDSSTGSLTSHKRSLKVQPSSSRLSISSIKEESVLSNSDAENVLPGSAVASPTAAATTPQQQGLVTTANSAVKSLEERIKMLDEMMDKQQKNKLGSESEKPVSTKLASASHLASSYAASSTAGKANKLSKLFDLDEQRLQSAAIIHVSMTLLT